MAKNKGSFNAAQGLFDKPVQGIEHASETQKVQYVQEVHEDKNNTLEGTRGRKGHKLPRINMAFTLNNHAYLKEASRRAGKNIAEYVNDLVDRDRERNR